MSKDDPPPHVTLTAAEIERLSANFDLSRKVALAAMAVLVVIGLALVAVAIGSLGFDPIAVGAIAAAILIGLAFLAWHRRTMRLYMNLLRAFETHQAKQHPHDRPPGENG